MGCVDSILRGADADGGEGAFRYDCPHCRARLGVAYQDRGRLVSCSSCGTQHPAPWRSGPYRDDDLIPCDEEYHTSCPHCRHDTRMTDRDSRRLQTCWHCEGCYLPASSPWQAWFRPVSRCLPRNDNRKDLDATICGERFLEAFEIRRAVERWKTDPEACGGPFEYYCGCCGRLAQAVAEVIARPARCEHCQTIGIIPAPRRPRAAVAVYEEDQPALRVHVVCFCPHCGSPAVGAVALLGAMVRCAVCDQAFALRGRLSDGSAGMIA